MSGVPSGGVVAAHLTCRVTPNPFNPRVTIALENPARQQVNVKIHDVRGMLVKSVYSDFADAGRKTLTWDGDDDRGHAVAAGIYLVTVSAGTERTVQKISLVK